jgi:hypothetical protein
MSGSFPKAIHLFRPVVKTDLPNTFARQVAGQIAAHDGEADDGD